MNMKKKIQAGQTLFTAWSVLPDALWAGALARTDFDVVTLDMQHGGHSDESILKCIGPVIQNGAHPVVRIPVGRFDMASRALDFGAEAVIAPMINTIADAKAFADSMKYPSLGQRSWGPGRAMEFHGFKDANAYFKGANESTLAIAMIETLDALAIADQILAIPGIDGIFVGPSDFSISWSKGAFVNPLDEGMTGILSNLADKAKAAGKFASSFGMDGKHARFLASLGYQLVTISTDQGCLAAGVSAAVASAKSST